MGHSSDSTGLISRSRELFLVCQVISAAIRRCTAMASNGGVVQLVDELHVESLFKVIDVLYKRWVRVALKGNRRRPMVEG